MFAFYSSINDTETSLEQANKSLKNAADHDQLTGLINRHGFFPVFENLTRQYEISKSPFCIAIGDIDNFKRVNDTYGHNIGDEVLKTVAVTIENILRGGDCICRWGGEEFIICLSKCGIEDGFNSLERVRTAISKLEIPDGHGGFFQFTMTFGLMEYSGKPMDDSVKVADDNLYIGKTTGKNKVVVSAVADNS
jgi:diguanylate cyclase (GGDEF)-like protein